MWFLVGRLAPLHVLKDKLDGYIAAGHIAADEKKDHYVQVFEQMLGVHRETNLHGSHDIARVATTTTTTEPDEETA